MTLLPRLAKLRGVPAVAMAAVVCGGAWAALAADVVAGGPVTEWDESAHAWFVSHRAGPVTTGMETVTWLGSTAVLIPLLLAAGGYLIWSRRDLPAALFLWAGFAGGWILGQAGKAIIARPRPAAADMITRVGGYAFPSGHSIQAMTGWGLLAVLAATSGALQRRTRVAVTGTYAVIIVLVGLSRIYLGVHWPSDVIGGFLLGAAWLCVFRPYDDDMAGSGPHRSAAPSSLRTTTAGATPKSSSHSRQAPRPADRPHCAQRKIRLLIVHPLTEIHRDAAR